MTYKRANRRRGALAARLCVVFGLLHIAAPSALSDTEIKDLFRKVTNSVVVVQTLERLVVDGRMPREQVISDLGAGVLISADGLIITAAHLVQAADRVLVRFAGGDSVPANVIASEPTADIALIRLEMVPESATVAPLGDSRQVAIGDRPHS